MNTRDHNAAKIETNKEFSDIATALKCGMDENCDISKLSHNQIVAMCDADTDGKTSICQRKNYILNNNV